MKPTANAARVAELHQLCREDFAKGQSQRSTPNLSTSYSMAVLPPMPEPSDLEVAISVGQQLLDSDSILSMREALRLLLRALDAEPTQANGTATVADLPQSISAISNQCATQSGATLAGLRESISTDSDSQATSPTVVADLPPAVTGLLAAVAEALDLPLPSTELADEKAYHALLVRRTTEVRILLESALDHPHVPIDRDAADVRKHIEQNPVTYTTFDEQKATAEARGEGQ